jgi:hypothetical protein
MPTVTLMAFFLAFWNSSATASVIGYGGGTVDLDDLSLGGLGAEQGDAGDGQGGNEFGLLEHGYSCTVGVFSCVQITEALLQSDDRL